MNTGQTTYKKLEGISKQ